MKNLFVQREFGFCTVYALANMFRSNHFIERFSSEDFKGCDDEKERLMFSSLDNDLSVSPVIEIRHNYDIPLPEDLVYKILEFQEPEHPDFDYEEFDLIPYLLSVRLINSHKFHHSVVVFNRLGTLYYIDPKNEDIIKIDNNLFDQFIDCWSIKRPYLKSTDTFVRLSSKSLGFEFK